MAGAKFIIILNGKIYKWEYFSNYLLDGLGKKLITQLTSKSFQEILNWIKTLPEDFSQDHEFLGNLFKLKALGSEINDVAESEEAYEMLYSYTIDFDSRLLSIWCKNARIGTLIHITNIEYMNQQLEELICLEKKLVK
jgi:hypothetical protein